MLKSLRRRFIGIIMAMVGSVLLAMIALSSANAQASLAQLVSSSLDRTLELTQAQGAGAGEGLGMQHLPVLWFDLSSSGVTLGTNESQLSIDEQGLRQALTDAMTSGASGGTVSGAHLAWKTRQTSYGLRVAIADTSSIDEARASQMAGDIRLAVASLAALYAVTFALSRWALRPVEVAWDQQHQFVADASHELKTPLAVILANTQILSRSETLAEQDRRWVDSCGEEARHMRSLVEGMLELARTEEGAGGTRANAEVDLTAIVERESLEFDAVAFERGCEISCEAAGDVSVMGDAQQLERLVKTLVENACKYAAEHSTIEVSLKRSAGTAELSVTNQGTPIDPEDLGHLFERFWRSDKARTRQTGGYGLGLAIAKGIVEAHGGKIWATSSAEAGTRLWVRLPVKGRS